jgi:type VI secretion system secreted protein VgrG
MATLTQANQPIEVGTPLGKDALLITSFRGEEGLSQLFHFTVDAIADAKKDIAFDKVLGQKVTIRLNVQNGKPRFFNGICNRFSQGEGDADFNTFRLEIVPQLWLLTKRANTRVFQQMSVPDILKKVLQGLDVGFQIDGTFHPRNYCVQYRETDFNFVSRLMEEEGIYYYFTHTADGHKMIVANTPASHLDMPINNKLTYERGVASNWLEDRVLTWEKQQEILTGNHTIWDHKFEMHLKNLEAKKVLPETVQVGKVAHKVKAGPADALEVYDYPGDFANRFDGINPGGGEQPAELAKITQDNVRVVGLRSQQEAVRSVTLNGTTTCRNLVSGHKFTLQKHGHGDGDYVITSIQHHATTPIDYFSNSPAEFRYHNSITAIPFAMPFRPQRVTPKPFVQGTQTAVVVGPSNEEIFCDKYGRVKVQFNWDREGKSDAKSSCWVRVATHWAGKKWGMIHIPRIGHEVVVGFEEGDPDLPIIIGSVYNNDHEPPYTLPKNKTQSGIKSRSTLKGTEANYNEIRFEDLKGQEHLNIHAERDMATTVEVNQNNTIGNNHVEVIGTNPDADPKKDGTSTTTVHGDTKLTVTKGDHVVTVSEGSAHLFVDGHNRVVIVEEQYSVMAKSILAQTGEEWIHFKSAADFDVNAATFIQHKIGESANYVLIKNDGSVTVSAASKIELGVAGNVITISDDGKISLTAGTEIKLTVGESTVTVDAAGVTVKGKQVTTDAVGVNTVKGGAKVDLNP